MHEIKPLGGKVFTPTFVGCGVIICFLLYFLAKRFIFGIGAVSAMNDGYPWGIWITYDMVVGSAFGCGGYAMALMCYVLNKGHYHPLVRPALLASMFGYCLGGVSVLVDIGRYLNVWNLYLPWRINPHSAMLEIALCVTAYCTVMILEFSPAFVERWKLKKCGAVLDKFIFLLIALGVLLPTMHQSSLGTMMIIAGHKLSPIWQSPMLPFFFLMTALFMGFGMVIFEGTLSSRIYRLGDETAMLSKVGAILAGFIAVFLVARVQTIAVQGAMGAALSGSFASNMFVIEFSVLFIGMCILLSRRLRNNPQGLFLAAALILIGGALYRFNVYLLGYNPGNGWTYFPSASEQMITYGLIAVEVAAYTFFVKYFPVFTVGHKSAAHNN